MQLHSLALLATVYLVSITSHAAPLVIKRDNQQQGGALTALTGKALPPLTNAPAPVTGQVNGVVSSTLALGASAQGLVPANAQDGFTGDKQALKIVKSTTQSLDQVTSGRGQQPKEN